MMAADQLLPAAIALIIIAAAVLAVVLLVRRTTVSIIVRKDPDMATIKERLAALEAGQADHADTLAGVAKAADVEALSSRVDDVESEIGTDPVAAPAPAAVDPIVTVPLGSVQTPMAG